MKFIAAFLSLSFSLQKHDSRSEQTHHLRHQTVNGRRKQLHHHINNPTIRLRQLPIKGSEPPLQFSFICLCFFSSVSVHSQTTQFSCCCCSERMSESIFILITPSSLQSFCF
ncbi:hypothetical protein RIF29_04553 [Crotalaria pallida]|uniref:Uncharacterized protein n=1 Tax=Crotalaria pallida TaxID=3830 RepID=A0AAN9J152_CROPI